ncbi:MAG: MBL fold metallo-hydrolase [Pseudomonadota bacterium]
MKLIVLGSGTGVPSLERNAPGYYLKMLDRECLIDCGSGTLLQLERAGRSYQHIDAVFITHTHPDHIGDLIPLIHALKVTPGFRREKTLSLFGPPGFKQFFDDYIVTVASLPKHFRVEIQEVDRIFKYAGVRCQCVPTVHSETLHSVAYRFEVGGRAVVLSGDCDYDEGIIQHSSQADLLVLDCSFTNALKYPGHCSAGECGRIATKAGVKRLLLTHLYPVPKADDTRLEEARAGYVGDVRLAEDLMEIEI